MGYNSVAKKGNVEKGYVNTAVAHIIRRIHSAGNVGARGVPTKLAPSLRAFVLDDHNWQSTKSLPFRRIKVVCAQKDVATWEKMRRSIPSSVESLHMQWAEDVELAPDSIDIDHLDFCCTWRSQKGFGATQTVQSRFEQKVYRHRAIVRLTVCARSSIKGYTVSKLMRDMFADITCSAAQNGYSIEFVPVSKWGDDRNAKNMLTNENSVVYQYGNPCMLTMIYIVNKNSF